MYIQCTQKLLAKLSQPYEELSNPPEAQYCWHANCFEHQGIVFVVMMNDYSEDEFFIQLDSFRDFKAQFVKELQRDMKETGISPEEISQYIKEAGPSTFGPISDRSKIAKLNGFTRRFKEFAISTLAFLHAMDEEARQEGRPLNFGESEKVYPTCKDKPKLALKTQKKTTSTKPTRTLMIALDVTLKLLGGKKVTRNFLVPIYMNFTALHDVLQVGFGWTDTHLHEFVFREYGFTVGTMENNSYSKGSELLGIPRMHDEDTTALSDLLPTVRRFTYFYDFGDDWEHVITVGEVGYVDGPPHAKCTGGQGMTPPEDSGGAYGYAQLRKILKNPKHEEYEEHALWAGYDFDGGFDLERTNKDLSDIVFTPQLIED